MVMLIVGTCVALGTLLDARSAFICTLLIHSVFAIFGSGTTSQTFADAYPGAIGQVMAALMIDNVDKSEWELFWVSVVINLVIACITFYAFMVRLGNYNPLAKLCNKEEDTMNIPKYDNTTDVEDNNGTQDDNILLEGKNIVKTYGVGEGSKASFQALDDVTFAIKEGSLLGLVGKSGAGVSKAMRGDDYIFLKFHKSSSLLFVCDYSFSLNLSHHPLPYL